MDVKETIRYVVFDAEADGLTPSKFYCLSYHDYNGDKGTLTDYEDIRSFFKSYDFYIGHNIIRWDLPNLERVVGITVPKRVIDTLGVSWYLEPKSKKNGLDDYGDELGVQKPKIFSWYDQKLEDYIYRCQEDVEINIRLWRKQYTQLFEIYEDRDEIFRLLAYLSFKLQSAALAEVSKWKLDIDLCNKELSRLEELKEEKYIILQQSMPKVPIIKVKTRPKKLYRKDGSPTALGQAWYERLKEHGLPDDYDGEIKEVVDYQEGNPDSHVQKKDWLYSLGWVPQTFKYQRNKETGDIKEIPQINKTKQEGGGVCESVQKLYDKDPSLEHLDNYSILSHRISILKGFLRDVDEDGYLQAKVSGLTNTMRFKHAEIVNLPKPETPFGENLRACLISPEGKELCGSDMSGLEDRLKQHYLYPYDPDYVSELQDDDYDSHLDIAVLGGLLTEAEAEAYKNGDHSKKAVRSIAKNTNYCAQYGGGKKRISITAGVDDATASNLYEAYWKKNWAIRACSKDQIVKEVLNSNEEMQKWLYNPISGFWYSLRTEKDVFSTLVQGSAAYCFDTWVSHILADRPEITAQFHDEVVLTVDKGHSHFNKETHKWEGPIVDWLKDCIEETNEFLQLNVKLDIDVQFGHRYSEIH